jgi:hypothetical protein
MKAQFIVTIEGDWQHNGKPVTSAIIEKTVRAALRDEFEHLASVKVKKAPAIREHAAQARADALEEAAAICDDKHYNWRFGDGEDSTSGPKECAAAIRAAASQGVDRKGAGERG